MRITNNLKTIRFPIIFSTALAQEVPEQGGYGRVDNPTRLALEDKLASLEKAKFALAFSSGSAAAATLLASFKAGDHILASRDIYEGTIRLLEKVFFKLGLKFTLIDLSDPSQLEIRLKKSIKRKTRLLWLENPSNPLLKTIDLKTISKIAAKKNIKILVDNTFATPIFQKPLDRGAHIVIHSLTKFINGHHDVTGGAIMLNDKKIFRKLQFLQQTMGAVPSPFDCFLIERGMLTLSLRMRKHQGNARRIARFLRHHNKVIRVNYPGFSGVLVFWLKGDRNNTLAFLKKLKLIKIAHSFGGAETTILHPVTMMGFSLSKSEREEIGITDNFLRLSVGLEDVDEIVKDLKIALG